MQIHEESTSSQQECGISARHTGVTLALETAVELTPLVLGTPTCGTSRTLVNKPRRRLGVNRDRLAPHGRVVAIRVRALE